MHLSNWLLIGYALVSAFGLGLGYGLFHIADLATKGDFSLIANYPPARKGMKQLLGIVAVVLVLSVVFHRPSWALYSMCLCLGFGVPLLFRIVRTRQSSRPRPS